VREDRQIRGEVRASNSPEHFAFVSADVVPRAYFPKGPDGIRLDLLQQHPYDLVF